MKSMSPSRRDVGACIYGHTIHRERSLGVDVDPGICLEVSMTMTVVCVSESREEGWFDVISWLLFFCTAPPTPTSPCNSPRNHSSNVVVTLPT